MLYEPIPHGNGWKIGPDYYAAEDGWTQHTIEFLARLAEKHENDIEEAYDRGYEEAEDQHADDYDTGYADGEAQGYHDGYQEGLTEAEELAQ